MKQCQEGLQFMNLAEEVMELDQLSRQTEDQVLYKGILECVHLNWMIAQHETHVRVLTLDGDHYYIKGD
jgi:hypothetical protein